MGFSIDDVIEVIQMVRKCENAEFIIETDEIKFSILKGEAEGGTRNLLDFSSSAGVSEQPAPEPARAEKAPAVNKEQETEKTPAETEPTAPSETAPLAPSEKIPDEKTIEEEGLVPIKATVTSVFYRRPSPSEPPFVEVGDEVEENTVLCLLEVMKCFRQVAAEVRGVVENICVESNTLVEEGTVLFIIRPK